jgi:ABC-2 type transport system permease protein
MSATDAGQVGLTPVPDHVGRLRRLARVYRVLARQGVQRELQYRTANYLYMIGMVVEPVVYLVVWTTVAEARGGAVGGYTAGEFAAYYIVWTLVRNMNIVFTPFGWEHRIRQGKLSELLLRPVHPLHYDIAYFGGWKVVVILLWLPIAAVLTIGFRPELSPNLAQVAAFGVAIWGAYIIRSLLLFALGMVTLWTTRVTALFELYFTAELLLSGRLVPLDLLPQWAQTVADWLPFASTFGFPIEALVADLSNAALVAGLVAQVAWTGVATVVCWAVWKRAVRRYSAVGN